MGRNYVVTVHADEDPLLERVRLRLSPDRLSFAISSTYVLYAVLDEVVDQYLPLLEQIEDELTELSGMAFSEPSQHVLSRLFALQQKLNYTGRVSGPQRDVINVLVNHQLLFIDHNSQYYLRDISDHLISTLYKSSLKTERQIKLMA